MVEGGLTIVSNRLPVTITDQSGEIIVGRSIGGLAIALGSVAKRGRARWVGWTGLESTIPAAKLKRAGLPKNLIPVQAPAKLMRGFYDNFSNRVLWPLLHGIRPCYDPSELDWKAYKEANRRFAVAALRATDPGGLLWVHDYHLLLVPRYLAEEGTNNRVGLFLHVPFPTPDKWFALPYAEEILDSLCQADVLGFQSQRDLRNFRSCVRTAGIRKPRCRAEVFPIGVDFEAYSSAPASPAIKLTTRLIREAAEGRKIIFSLSRLDYTKGILAQLLAAERFLAGTNKREDYVYKLIVAPSRERLDEYQDLRANIDRLVADINHRLGNGRWQPVDYSYRNIGFEDVVSHFSAADVLMVLPDMDGMNLVTKEYIAARQDDKGMLIMTGTTGAACQLKDALRVAPHDIGAAARALKRAFDMPAAERKRRWRHLRASVREQDVFWWAESFVSALATPGGQPKLMI